MALVGFPGSKGGAYIGHNPFHHVGPPQTTNITLDAANEAVIMVGQIETSDEGSHTINTTGSSKIEWRTSTVTFANAATTVKVGLAAVLTTVGPPARAANASDVITFDVSKSHTGGGGGITAGAWQSNVPDTGSKTIAHGDLVAACIQMTARGGADSVQPIFFNFGALRHSPTVTAFTGGTYAAQVVAPNILITFSDGATGWFFGGDIFSLLTTRTWNSGSATKEYGQLYQLPFPVKVYGVYGYIDPDGDSEVVLYSSPLGTPVAERTIVLDVNTTGSATANRFEMLFSSPYTVPANTAFGLVYKPGGTNISAFFKTLANAGHRITDPWGTSGYGISRASGAFADANSSLDHYLIGAIAGAFDTGGLSRARAWSGF